MRKVTCITINTDASFHPIEKVGGYAFYIVCDLFKITKSGMFKAHPKHAQEAEIMCIGNAIATLLSQKELPTSKWIILNTDCLVAVDMIKANSQPVPKKVFELWDELTTKLQSDNKEFRHVKSHNGKDNARSYVNDWCDKEAKKWMRLALNEKKKSITTCPNKSQL